MRVDVFTLFPEWFDWFRDQRHVRNAIERGSELRLFDYRRSTPLSGRQVDDSPYGGGAGMVLRVDVVDAALESAYGDRRPGRIVLLAASGRQFDEALAAELAAEPEVALLCGRYEGVDERVREHLATDAVSVGPYVLSGGELAAMVVADAVIRKLPGALGHAESAVEESFSAALGGAPEYPHYTRPADYRGWRVPDVLLSGDHERVRRWRREQSRERAGPGGGHGGERPGPGGEGRGEGGSHGGEGPGGEGSGAHGEERGGHGDEGPGGRGGAGGGDSGEGPGGHGGERGGHGGR